MRTPSDAQRFAPVGPAEVAPRDRGRRALVFAWISVAVIPAAFGAGYVAATWVLRLQGYELGEGGFWPNLLGLVPGLVTLDLIAAASIVFGRRARASGYESGLYAAAIGAVIAGGFTLLQVLVVVLHLLGFE